jgi:hypothetical protein
MPVQTQESGGRGRPGLRGPQGLQGPPKTARTESLVATASTANPDAMAKTERTEYLVKRERSEYPAEMDFPVKTESLARRVEMATTARTA